MVDSATDHKGFFIQNLQSVDSLSSTDISHVAFQVTRRYITQGKTGSISRPTFGVILSVNTVTFHGTLVQLLIPIGSQAYG